MGDTSPRDVGRKSAALQTTQGVLALPGIRRVAFGAELLRLDAQPRGCCQSRVAGLRSAKMLVERELLRLNIPPHARHAVLCSQSLRNVGNGAKCLHAQRICV